MTRNNHDVDLTGERSQSSLSLWFSFPFSCQDQSTSVVQTTWLKAQPTFTWRPVLGLPRQCLCRNPGTSFLDAVKEGGLSSRQVNPSAITYQLCDFGEVTQLLSLSFHNCKTRIIIYNFQSCCEIKWGKSCKVSRSSWPSKGSHCCKLISIPPPQLPHPPTGLLPCWPGSESCLLCPLCLFSFPSQFQILPWISPNLVLCNCISLKLRDVPMLEISWMFSVFSCFQHLLHCVLV